MASNDFLPLLDILARVVSLPAIAAMTTGCEILRVIPRSCWVNMIDFEKWPHLERTAIKTAVDAEETVALVNVIPLVCNFALPFLD
jgi:hypothetical protein